MTVIDFEPAVSEKSNVERASVVNEHQYPKLFARNFNGSWFWFNNKWLSHDGRVIERTKEGFILRPRNSLSRRDAARHYRFTLEDLLSHTVVV